MKLKGKQIKDQTVTINGDYGDVKVMGDLNMNNYNILVSSTPSTDNHLVNKAYVDEFFSEENVIRIIYVDSVNGLDTNNGSNSGNSFKTIAAALLTINKYVKAGITVQLAVGNYVWNANCELIYSKLIISSYVRILGTFVLDDTNLVLTRNISDYTKYNVTKSGSAVTWLDNQYNDYFIFKPTSTTYLPIMYNSGNTIHVLNCPATLSATYNIGHMGSILLVTSTSSTGTSNYLCVNNNGSVGSLYFYNLNIKNQTGLPLSIGGCRVKISIYYSIIELDMPAYKQALSFTSIYTLYLSSVGIAYKNTISMGTSWNQAVSFSNNNDIYISGTYIRYDGTQVLNNERGFKFYAQAPRIGLYSIGVRNFPFGISLEDCNIYMPPATNNTSSTANWKFSNCGCCLYFEETPLTINTSMYYIGYGMSGALFCDNTNYIIQRTAPTTNLHLFIGKIIGTPVSGFEYKETGTQYWTTWSKSGSTVLGGDRVLSKKPDYEFTYYDPKLELSIQIGDNSGGYGIYNSEEFSRLLSANASATTTLIVGDNTQNKNITINYNAVRGSLEHTNTINILCKTGSTIYNIGSYFGDDLGLSFTVSNDITNINLIKLSVIVNNMNTIKVTIKYDIKRINI